MKLHGAIGQYPNSLGQFRRKSGKNRREQICSSLDTSPPTPRRDRIDGYIGTEAPA